jgi:hypothetical protein
MPKTPEIDWCDLLGCTMSVGDPSQCGIHKYLSGISNRSKREEEIARLLAKVGTNPDEVLGICENTLFHWDRRGGLPEVIRQF